MQVFAIEAQSDGIDIHAEANPTAVRASYTPFLRCGENACVISIPSSSHLIHYR
jgi:hypothetical protein